MFFYNKNPLVALLLLHYLFMSNLNKISWQQTLQNKNFHFEGGAKYRMLTAAFCSTSEGSHFIFWIQTLTLYHQIAPLKMNRELYFDLYQM